MTVAYRAAWLETTENYLKATGLAIKNVAMASFMSDLSTAEILSILSGSGWTLLIASKLSLAFNVLKTQRQMSLAPYLTLSDPLHPICSLL